MGMLKDHLSKMGLINEGLIEVNEGFGVERGDSLKILVSELDKELKKYNLSVDTMKSYKSYARDSMNLDSIQKIQERGAKFEKDPASMVRVAIFETESYVRGCVYNLYFKTCKTITVDSERGNKITASETTQERGAINNFNLDKSMKTSTGITVTFLKK